MYFKVSVLLAYNKINMAKKVTSFSLNEETLLLLKKLAEKHDRSQANMLDVLIKEAAKKEKIKP